MKGQDAWPSFPAFEFGQEFHRTLLEPHLPPRVKLSEADSYTITRMKEAVRKDPIYKYIKQFKNRKVEVRKMIPDYLGVPWKGRADVWIPDKMTVDYKTTAAQKRDEFEFFISLWHWDVQGLIYMKLFDVDSHLIIGINKLHKPRIFKKDLRIMIYKKIGDLEDYIKKAIDFFDKRYQGSFDKYYQHHGTV